MPTEGGQKWRDTLIKQHGGEAGFKAEMARRARMRKTIGKGGFYDPEVAVKAALKSAEVRRKNAKNKLKTKQAASGQSDAEAQEVDTGSQA
jgi:hypothetical protein